MSRRRSQDDSVGAEGAAGLSRAAFTAHGPGDAALSSPPMSSPAVWITGVGLLTPLGNSAWGTMRALFEGRTITDRLADLAEPIGAEQIIRGTGSIADARHDSGDPAATLALRALHEAITGAGLSAADLTSIPILLASSKGAISALLDPIRSREAAALGPHGLLDSLIQSRTGAPFCRAVAAACASGVVALDQGLRLLRRGEATRVAVVAVEASLVPLLMHSYRRLGVLAPPTSREYRARPLDRRRRGFVLTDLAAAVILESRPPARRNPSAAALPPLRLLGVRTAAEAHHVIKSPADSAALNRLSSWACGAFGSLDLLHPHATGTMENDEAEAAVHAQALGPRAAETPVYAVKGAVGHGLGAAGLASVVVGAMIARCGRVPPMPWLGEPITTPLRLSREGTQGAFRRQAIFASGFGGHCAAAVIEADSA